MRTKLDEANAPQGIEPITELTILGTQYSTEDSLINVSDFSDTVKIGQSGAFSNISVSIYGVKSLYDNNDLYNLPVTVSQRYRTNDGLSDSIPIFTGNIATPIQWDEKDNTLSFDIITDTLDAECGLTLKRDVESYPFTPMDGAYDDPLPIVFGTVKSVLATKITEAITTDTTEALDRQTSMVKVADGSVFPQDESMLLLIGKYVIMGTFNGNELTIDEHNLPRYTGLTLAGRETSDDDSDNPKVIWLEGNYSNLQGAYFYGSGRYKMSIKSEYSVDTLKTKFWFAYPWINDEYPAYPVTMEAALFPRTEWSVPASTYYCLTVKSGTGIFRINSNGTPHVDSQERYIYAINPIDTLYAVKARRTLNDVDIDADIPISYFTDEMIDIEGTSCHVLTFDQSLSAHEGENWKDDVYVSCKTAADYCGPSAIEYLLNTYSEYTIDTESFEIAKIACAGYPTNFSLKHNGDVYTLSEDIAWQTRCALYNRNNVIFIKYLSAEPSSTKTLYDDDFEIKKTTLSLTDEADLLTRLTGVWKETDLDKKDKEFTLENNISKYGVREDRYPFFVFNIEANIEQSVKHWLNRCSTFWKKVNIFSFESNIDLESQDCILIGSTDGMVPEVKGIIESTNIQAHGVIILSAWLSAEVGTITQSDDAWLTDIVVPQMILTDELREYTVDIDTASAENMSNNYNNYDGDDDESITNTLFSGNKCLPATIINDIVNSETIEVRLIPNGVPAWSGDNDYVIGNIVLYADTIYRCTQNHTAEENILPTYTSHWVLVGDIEAHGLFCKEGLTFSTCNESFVRDQIVLITLLEDTWFLIEHLNPRPVNKQVFAATCNEDADTGTQISAHLKEKETAADWVSDGVYMWGDCVIHNTKLYMCTVSHSAENITPSLSSFYWEDIDEITVNCLVYEEEGTDLKDCLPLLYEDSEVFIQKQHDDNWWSIDTFHIGGGSGGDPTQWARVTQVPEYDDPEKAKYIVEKIRVNPTTLLWEPYDPVIEISKVYGQGEMTDGREDIRNYVPWYVVNAWIKIIERWNQTTQEDEWLIDMPLIFTGEPTECSIRFDSDKKITQAVWV